MSIETNGTKLTGPLNALQIQVVRQLADGKTHQEIADNLGYSRVAVSDNARVAARKMGCVNGAEMMFVFGQQNAYEAVSEWLLTQLIRDPIGDVETHFNECTRDMSAEVRAKGRSLKGSRPRD